MCQEITDKPSELLRKMVGRFLIVAVFSIAFGYIEAAVVVYLRSIFHPEGFTFPLTAFGISEPESKLILVEIGREAATMALIFTAAWLFGRNRRQRVAYFMVIFAVWDIFYYIWLKVLINWPGSIMDWDILFLMPIVWASSVLAPVIVSLTMLVFAAIILYRDRQGLGIEVKLLDWLGFVIAAVIFIASFLIGGLYCGEPDYKSHFYWWLFGVGEILAVVLFVKCLLKSSRAS